MTNENKTLEQYLADNKCLTVEEITKQGYNNITSLAEMDLAPEALVLLN